MGAIFRGLLVALVATLIAFAVSAAGHGWTAPIAFSLFLFALCPWAEFEAEQADAGDTSIRRDVVLLAIAVIGDALLVYNIIFEEFRYFEASPLSLVWLLFWLGWQVRAGLTLNAKLGNPVD
jgi:hypothetical protein